MNALIFNSSWPPAACVLLAFAAAAATYFLYKRETQCSSHSVAKALPWLRSIAVGMLTFMLAGPTLRQTLTIGTPTKLSLFVDCSQSMGTADREMETVRKLSIARNLRWLNTSAEFSSDEKVAESLSRACRMVRAAMNGPLIGEDNLHKATTEFLSDLVDARKHSEKGTFSAAELKGIDQALLTPLRQFVARKQRTPGYANGPPKELIGFLDTADRWQQAATQKVTSAAIAEAGGDRKVAAVLERLDETSRLERIRTILLDGGNDSMIGRLSKSFEIELLSLTNDSSRVLWRSAENPDASSCVFPKPDSTSTNIGSAIFDRLNGVSSASKNSSTAAQSQPRAAAILFTDGRHNAQGSPVEVAKRLGDAGIPIYCIGVGSNVRPVDLAVSDIEAPDTVFYEDRVSGSITIKDDMVPGQSFKLEITSAGRVLWRKELITSQRGALKIPFDFPIKELVSLSLTDVKIRHSVLPIALKASLTVLPQEREIRNNTADFLVRATTGRRRMLLIDGRPRWETRYIKNLYERDPQWSVNWLFADSGSSLLMQRGTLPGSFPSDESLLNEYDIIILGDLSSSTLSDSELTWIYNFVTKRGGGLLLIDGQRRALSGYDQTTLSQLLPVAFPDPKLGATESPAEALLLTEAGQRANTLKLDPDAQNSEDTWSGLAAPRRVTRTVALPGSEVLVEAKTSSDRIPALVTRRQGAGNVAYMAFDESWRWRSGVAGKFQERFWSQLVNSIADPTFSSSNDKVSLDTDAFRYSPGSTAIIRARTKSSKQKESLKGSIWRDGLKVGSVELFADPARHDVFSGKTAPLEIGAYDFGLDEGSDEPGSGLKVRFEVQAEEKGELAELTLDETLLTQIAKVSRGHYLREENTSALFELVHPLETAQIVTTETPISQGFPWFAAIISLLSIEWMLRKRAGLI